ncbi:21_t:CDS:10 [Funneliformis geosporum]|nr:21_t:CDS:10 [Funneliformis geosporum]
MLSTPASEWTYPGYLEKMQPYFNNHFKLSSLKSTWKKRFNEHLREIERDQVAKSNGRDRCQQNIIASLYNCTTRGAGDALLTPGVGDVLGAMYKSASTIQVKGLKATELWNQFEKKRALQNQQHNTNIDIQLSTLRVMSTSATCQEDELAGQMVASSISGKKNVKHNKNAKRQSDEYPEREKQKSRKTSIENSHQAECSYRLNNVLNVQESFDENDEEEVIQNAEVITDFLGNDIECSEASKKLCSAYMEHYPDGDLIDLRSCSSFLRNIPRSISSSYLSEMDTITEQLIPDNVHNFLVQFFSQTISDTEWQGKVDDLRSPEEKDPLMVAVVRILRRTLPQFIKAFSLGHQNPLLNIATIEQAHLNAFVHPCLDSALWNLANIHYEYGEIPSRNHVNKNRADGVGYMTNADKFQLVYVEGSRPNVKQEKEVADIKKIINNMKSLFSKIVKELIKTRRRLPEKLNIFGGQSFRLRIYLYYLDYCGKYRLNEVDNANLPREFSEMPDFVYFYECVLKWALLIQASVTSFNEARVEKRPSRMSYAESLFRLQE